MNSMINNNPDPPQFEYKISSPVSEEFARKYECPKERSKGKQWKAFID